MAFLLKNIVNIPIDVYQSVYVCSQWKALDEYVGKKRTGRIDKMMYKVYIEKFDEWVNVYVSSLTQSVAIEQLPTGLFDVKFKGLLFEPYVVNKIKKMIGLKGTADDIELVSRLQSNAIE